MAVDPFAVISGSKPVVEAARALVPVEHLPGHSDISTRMSLGQCGLEEPLPDPFPAARRGYDDVLEVEPTAGPGGEPDVPEREADNRASVLCLLYTSDAADE